MSAPASSSVELAVDQPRRVGPPVVRPAGAGGDQVGVGRRQQQDGRCEMGGGRPSATHHSYRTDRLHGAVGAQPSLPQRPCQVCG